MDPVRQLPSGAVAGLREERCNIFRGIPYAHVPQRFAEPEQMPSWTGVRAARDFGPTPPQGTRMLRPGAGAVAEDCLVLTVWEPLDGRAIKPVLVYVYGGGFEGGTSQTPHLDGSHLAIEGDLIVVAINYRVGFLGFGYQPGRIPSNLGLRDVLAALRWVQANISAFRGSPDDVTVMGQSAGGFLAGALLAVPDARPLFDRLIMCSGAASRLVQPQQAERLTRDWLMKAGIDPTSGSADGVALDVLLDAQSVIPMDIGVRNAAEVQALGVVLDAGIEGGVLAMHPMDAATSEANRDVDVLIGVTNAEISMFRQFSPDFDPASHDQLVAEVTSWGVPLDRSGKIVDQYLATAGDLGAAREHLLTDWIYRLPAGRLAETRVVAGMPARTVEFRGSLDGPLGHGGEHGALFGDDFFPLPTPEYPTHVQKLMCDFANGASDVPDFRSGLTRVIGSSVRDDSSVFSQALETWSGVPRP